MIPISQSGKSPSDRVVSYNGCSSNVKSSTYGDNCNTESALNQLLPACESVPQITLSPSEFCRRSDENQAFATRFWSQVDQSTACWLWTGKTIRRRGYGYMWSAARKKTLHSHRVAWELTRGPIPAALHVLHRCDDPRCCNPEHLYLGTHQDNMRDMHGKGRRSPHAHSPKGRKWSPEQRRKLMAIRRERAMQRTA